MQDDGLDDLFRQARASDAPPSDRLVARVLADADQVQRGLAAPAASERRPAAGAGSGWLARLVGSLGGSGAFAGLAAAGVAGVALGLAQPASLAPWSAGLWSAAEVDTVELFPDIDALFAGTEG